MSNRGWGPLLAIIVGTIISLAPISAAAQNQAPPQPLHFDPIANPRALCPEKSGGRGTSKERLLALPADVVDPTRTPEGWPDLQGTWNSDAYPASARHSIEIGVDPIDIAVQCQPLEKLNTERANMLIDPLKGRIPYQPWAKAKQMEFLAGMYAPGKRMDLDPESRCFFLLGVPHGMLGWGIELRYVPGAVVVLSNKGTRIVPMDGAPHLSDDIKLFMGDSRGHWDGHTLVIETTDNRDGTWFDKHGTFHSDAMRVTERFTLVSPGTMYYEVTIVDPTVFTQPWKLSQTFDRQKRSPIVDPEGHENLCHEEDGAAERTVRAGLRGRAVGLHGYHIHVDLVTGKAIDPADQKYLDESGQPLGYSFVPGVPDSAIPVQPAQKDGSAAH